jgi:hypothetical protein
MHVPQGSMWQKILKFFWFFWRELNKALCTNFDVYEMNRVYRDACEMENNLGVFSFPFFPKYFRFWFIILHNGTKHHVIFFCQK